MEKRNSKIEILRIISIILIVLSHYVVHSGVDIHDMPFGINRYILELGVLGNIGTMLFIFITGYFLVGSYKIKFKKIFHYLLQVFFYSSIIYILMVLLGREPFDIKELMINFFPLTFKRYWFATAYFIIYLFHPYINKFINSLSRKEYTNFIILSVFLFFFLSTLTTMDFYGNEIIYFVTFYSIGAYMSKYRDNYFFRKNNSKKILITTILMIAFSVFIFDFMGTKIVFFGAHSNYLLNIYSFVALLLSISLFSIFANSKPTTNKIINYIASMVFGVYLISDNKYLRSIIWCELLNNQKFFLSNCLLLHIISSVIMVFVMCVLMEMIRNLVFKKFIYKWLDPRLEKSQEAISLKLKEQKKVL